MLRCFYGTKDNALYRFEIWDFISWNDLLKEKGKKLSHLSLSGNFFSKHHPSSTRQPLKDIELE